MSCSDLSGRPSPGPKKAATRGGGATTRPAPIHTPSSTYRLGEAYTLEETAAALGVTKQAVQQTEVKALRKVRAALEARGLDGDTVLAAMTDEASQRIQTPGRNP